MAILSASPSFAATKGDSVTVTLSRSELAAIISGDIYYSNAAVMRRVVVIFRNENQVKVLDFPQGITEDTISFSSTVKEGSFELVGVQIQDFDSGSYTLTLSELNAIAGADFTISSNVIVGSPIAWGFNFLGRIGDGSTTDRSTFVSISSPINLSSTVSVSCGASNSSVLTEDGIAWTTGEGFTGALGTGSTTNVSTFTQVIGLSDVKAIAQSRDNTRFLRSNGTIWATGSNGQLQLGDGLGNRSSPIQVGSKSDFAILADYSTSGLNESILGIASDGTLWGVGANGFGTLGIGSTANTSVFTQVIGHSNFASAFGAHNYSLALKSDGTLWATGENNFGQFGNNTAVTATSSFVQCTTISNVMYACGGSSGSTYAIKSDGTLWAVGNNFYGELAIGNTSDKSSFVQIIGHSNFKKVSAGSNFVVAMKSDGTVWAAGFGNGFRLGTGNTNNQSSLVQISGISTAFDVSAGNFHVIVLKTP